MNNGSPSRVAVACQGGGSHTAFTAGVLQGLLTNPPEDVEIVALSGTSGGAVCAALAWDGLVRGDPMLGVRKLQSFWEAMSARDPLDKVLNQLLLGQLSLRDLMVMPEISPYLLPTWGEDRYRQILEGLFDFPELRRLATRPGAPTLQIGAVEVLSGHFELFTGEEISADCLLASAAIPELFRAVPIPGRGVYWDGLFSQNPPIHDLFDRELDELWVVQINPSTCLRVPTETHEIFDRRNELSGNLSMEQELGFVETINRAIARGIIREPRLRHVQIERVVLDRQLDHRSKLDRNPVFLDELREYGRTKWRGFRKQRSTNLASQLARGAHPLPPTEAVAGEEGSAQP